MTHPANPMDGLPVPAWLPKPVHPGIHPHMDAQLFSILIQLLGILIVYHRLRQAIARQQAKLHRMRIAQNQNLAFYALRPKPRPLRRASDAKRVNAHPVQLLRHRNHAMSIRVRLHCRHQPALLWKARLQKADILPQRAFGKLNPRPPAQKRLLLKARQNPCDALRSDKRANAYQKVKDQAVVHHDPSLPKLFRYAAHQHNHQRVQDIDPGGDRPEPGTRFQVQGQQKTI